MNIKNDKCKFRTISLKSHPLWVNLYRDIMLIHYVPEAFYINNMFGQDIN